MKFQSNAIFNGLITANQVSDAGVNTGKFLVLTASGVMAYRTAAEILSDIGAASAAQGVPAGGTAGQILSKVNGTDYNTEWIDNYSTQIKVPVKLGATLTKGTPVYESSADGTNIIVSAAGNGAESTSSKTLGLLETGGATNAQVKVVTYGLLAGLDTSTATAGDPVWLGPNGTLLFGLANKPVAPVHMVYIGVVTRVHSVNGEIFVNVQNGFEMGELHNYAEGSVANNQVIVYESATSLYKPKSIPTILGYTPANAATTLTINDVTYDLSANRSWTISSTSVSTRVIQKFTADGTTATYTITGGYTVGMVDVYVNGIKLDNASGVEFTATNGTTVVLVSTPASGDIVEVYKYGSQFIANNALRQKTLFTATAGQTTFTVTYSVGMVDVFYNGSKLDDTEYTATNGTSIVLGTACAVNDKVEVIAYSYNVNGFTGIGGSGTANYIPKFTAAGLIGNSLIYDNGSAVGINTTSVSGTYGKLSVAGGISILDDNNAKLEIGRYSSGASNSYIKLGANSNSLRFTNATDNVDLVTFTNSGNVGIGTSSPQALLHLSTTSGNTAQYIQSTGSGSYALTSYSNTTTGYGYDVGFGGSSSIAGNCFYIYGGSSTSLKLIINSSGYTKMTNDGTFYGSTSNYHELRNTLADATVRVSNSNASPYGISVYFTGADPNNTSNYLFNAVSSSSGVTLYNIWSNGTTSGRSDIRLKKNIVDATPKLDSLMKLRVVNYEWKESLNGTKEIGLIAQEVEEVFPNLVITEPVIKTREVEQEDGTIIEEKYEDGDSKSIKHSVLPFMLLKALQEANAKIEELSAKVTASEQQINDLKKLIN